MGRPNLHLESLLALLQRVSLVRIGLGIHNNLDHSTEKRAWKTLSPELAQKP